MLTLTYMLSNVILFKIFVFCRNITSDSSPRLIRVSLRSTSICLASCLQSGQLLTPMFSAAGRGGRGRPL